MDGVRMPLILEQMTNPHKETWKTQEMPSLFCTGYISEQKQQKGTYKTQHAAANGDEVSPSLGGKASESDDPTSSPTKKTEVASHRIPMSCLIRRGKGHEC